MDTSLLKLARRDKSGSRRWTVPGYSNHAVLVPARMSYHEGWGASFRWPARDASGALMVRSVDLNRHRAMARAAVKALLQEVQAANV